MTVKVSDPLYVLYDGDCGLCSRTAQALRILDRRGRLRLLPLQLAGVKLGTAAPPLATMRQTLHAGDPGRGWSNGGAASLRIARAIPVLRSLAVVGSLPLLNRLVEPVYVLLASNRDRIGHVLGAAHCRFDGDAP